MATTRARTAAYQSRGTPRGNQGPIPGSPSSLRRTSSVHGNSPRPSIVNGRIQKGSALPSRSSRTTYGQHQTGRGRANKSIAEILESDYDRSRDIPDHSGRQYSYEDGDDQGVQHGRSSHDLRIEKARFIFERDARAKPILKQPYENRHASDLLYYGHLGGPVSQVFSPERRQFISRQAEIDEGRQPGWFGFANSGALPVDSYKAAKTLEGYEYYPRVQQHGSGLRMLERRGALDLLTSAERKELIKWWQARFNKPLVTPTRDTFRIGKNKAKKHRSLMERIIDVGKIFAGRRRKREEKARREDEQDAWKNYGPGKAWQQQYDRSVYGRAGKDAYYNGLDY